MFTLIDDFFNYDCSERIEVVDKPSDLSDNNFQYQIIVNFTNMIPESIILADEPMKISTMVPSKAFVNDILKSYLSTELLHQQFIIDIKRGKLVINGNKVKSPITALNYLNYTHNQRSSRIIACATQATCAAAFEWIYNSLPENFHLSEMKSGDQKKSVIRITGNTLKYHKGLRIFKLENGDDHTLYKVLMVITIDDAINNTGDVTIDFDIIPI